MAFDDRHGQSSTAKYALDLLTYNPFASDRQVEQDVNTSTTSGVTNNSDYGSDAEHTITTQFQLSSASEENNGIQFRDHARREPHRGSGYLHPLRSAGVRVGSDDDAGITRPHLSRIVNVGTLVDAPPLQPDPSYKHLRRIEEKDVLVHEVEVGDSLAGVSLKYGISMAELRRVNHLWSSDSIHMRKQLYIPLEKATRRQKDGILISISPAEEREDPLKDIEASEGQSSVLSDFPSSNVETIRRIPASQLSFFPPASKMKSSIPTRYSPYIQQPTSSTSHKINYNHNRYASSPSHSLTSILTALPIAASTRDTIIARLSFDSVSSSLSDQEQINDHHEGLELDDVQYAGPSKLSAHDHINDTISLGHTLPTPTASFRATRSDRSSVRSQPPSPTHVRTLSSSPHSYIPPHAQVRTMQLEPSPGMQLPPFKAPRQESKKESPDTALTAGLESGRIAP